VSVSAREFQKYNYIFTEGKMHSPPFIRNIQARIAGCCNKFIHCCWRCWKWLVERINSVGTLYLLKPNWCSVMEQFPKSEDFAESIWVFFCRFLTLQIWTLIDDCCQLETKRSWAVSS
jgi:hypothetical protein